MKRLLAAALVAAALLSGCAVEAPREEPSPSPSPAAPSPSPPAPSPAEPATGEDVILENRGVGTGYDGTALVGKHFSSVPRGSTVAEVCAYMLPSPDAVTYALAVSPSKPARLHEGRIQSPERAGWACDRLSLRWDASTLFVFRTGGTANVSFELPSPPGDSYHFHSGAWNFQPDITRGYRVRLLVSEATPTPASMTLENGGVGTGFDNTAQVGKFFPRAPSARLREVCAYLGASSGSVSYAIAASPTNDAAVIEGTIQAGEATGFVCDEVDLAWDHPTIFVYRTGGAGVVSYEQPVARGDSYHRQPGGWQAQSDIKRGYRLGFDG